MKKFLQHRGFSVLMAIGIIAILMIVVSGLATLYMKEFKISRLSYDEVTAYASAEWAFEYAMLKIKNHDSGFQDELNADSEDGKNFFLETNRSKDMKTSYAIRASSTEEKMRFSKSGFIVVPLFSDEGQKIHDENPSKKPNKNTSKNRSVTNINAEGLNNEDNWVITAYADELGSNVNLKWVWSIHGNAQGAMSILRYQCIYIENEAPVVFESFFPCGDGEHDIENQSKHATYQQIQSSQPDMTQEQIYSYELHETVANFLGGIGTTKNFSGNKLADDGEITWEDVSNKTTELTLHNPYLIIYRANWAGDEITVKSENIPFSLPYYSVRAEAKIADASQVFDFYNDSTEFLELLVYDYFRADSTSNE